MSYPVSPFEVVLPELVNRTVKMYRGGRICLSSHFKPLWAKNVPHFGIAHELAMGVTHTTQQHNDSTEQTQHNTQHISYTVHTDHTRH